MSATLTRPPQDAAPAALPTPPHTPWLRSVLLAIGAAAVVVVVLLAFLWPTITSSRWPRVAPTIA